MKKKQSKQSEPATQDDLTQLKDCIHAFFNERVTPFIADLYNRVQKLDGQKTDFDKIVKKPKVKKDKDKKNNG